MYRKKITEIVKGKIKWKKKSLKPQYKNDVEQFKIL